MPSIELIGGREALFGSVKITHPLDYQGRPKSSSIAIKVALEAIGAAQS